MVTTILILLGFIGAFIFFYKAIKAAKEEGWHQAVSEFEAQEAKKIVAINRYTKKREAEIDAKFKGALPNDWPNTGLVVLSEQNSFDPSVTTSAQLLEDDR